MPEAQIRTSSTRASLAGNEVTLTPAARQRIAVGYAMIDATDSAALPLKAQLQRFGMHEPACRTLVDHHFGIGGLLAVAVWCELGDCRRFSRSDQVVRHTGLDVTVDASDLHRAHGYLSRQGHRRCGGRCSKRPTTLPGTAARSRLLPQGEGRPRRKLAAISVARQFARRCYHLLRNLDPDVVYADAV